MRWRLGGVARLRLRSHVTRVIAYGFALATAVQPLAAAPHGGTIIQGTGSIAYDGDTVTIDQTSDRLIIEWQSFDTTSGQSVVFNQPGVTSGALNRILSGQATQFDGSLTANGLIILTNAAGINFGSTARIDAGSLIASVAGISNRNFMNGLMIFDQPGLPDAMITNEGVISVRDEGLAALVAPGVENSGLIMARLGTVILGAGEAHTIDFYGDGLVNFAITSPTRKAPRRRDGSKADALVSNKGKVYADGGAVVMSARQVSGVLDQAINMSGVVRANSVGMRNGKIVLGGGRSGRVRVSGKVRARGVKRGERGGTVHVTGKKVELIETASVDVSGAAGGGIALIGGARQGGKLSPNGEIGYLDEGGLFSILIGPGAAAANDGAIPNAETTYIAAGATINASATDAGDGGEVIVWADGYTGFNGLISARGGAVSGDGGFVETSGMLGLAVSADAFVDALAPNGAVGDWLLDPATVTVQTGGTATLTQIADAADTTSNLVVDPGTINAAGANVSIVASQTVTFADAVNMTNAGVGLTVQAGNSITVNAALTTTNGNITFLSDNYDLNAAVNAGTGTLKFDRVTAGLMDIGLAPGSSSGGAELDTAELALLTAGDLLFGDPLAAQNQVSTLSLRQFPSNPNISGLVQFNALDGAGSFLLAFGNQTYLSVEFNANDGVTFTADATIATSVGDATFNVDADGTGVVGGFDNLEVNDGVTAVVNSAANILVKTPDIRERGTGTISLNANAGAGAITFARSSAGTIGVGGGNGRFMSFSDVQLTRLTAGTINFGDPTTPNNTSAINVNAADLSGIGTVNFNTAGATSFSGANSFSALATSGGTTTVANGGTVGATGTLAFNTTTVNLDGNLTATGGISGTATTINVQGAAGGAEVQDGIAVAVNTGATVNVSDGTYAESVLLNKANVSLVGGAGAIIAPASPAFTISAAGTTVDGFTYSGTAGSPALLVTAGADNVTIRNGTITGTTGTGDGIQIDNTVTAGLTIDISNVTMTGVAQDGISFDGALNGANIDISSSSITAGRHGILFNGAITNATTDIDIFGNTRIEGASQGIVFTRGVTDATVRIRGNGTDASNGIRGAADAIAVNGGSLTGATFIIGGDTAADGNFIVATSGSQGLDIDAISGGRFVVANNDLIQGGPAIEFEQAITNNAEIVVVDNGDIDGGRGIQFRGNIDTASVTIAGNSFTNSPNDAIEFVAGSSIADSTVTIGSATNVMIDTTTVNVGGNTMDGSGNTGADGIDVAAVVQGATNFVITDNIIGGAGARVGGDGIAFRGGILGTATVTLGGNTVFTTDKAIEVDDLQSPSTLAITGGTYNGTGGALLVDNTGVAGTDGRLNVGAAAFVAGAASRVMEVLTDTGNAGVDIDFNGAASFDGGATGIRLSGTGIDILNNTMGAISFLSELTTYIELANGAEFLPGSPTVIDATGVSFNGVLGSALTGAQALAVEDRLTHFPDNNTLGLFNTNNLFVTVGESIQTAVNAAGALAGAQTVTVGAGTFGGSVEVWVDNLTLQGQGATTIIDTDAIDAFANNGDANNGFQVAAISALSGGGDVTGATIDGFRFDTVTTTGSNTGVELGETGTSTAIGATVRNSTFNDLSNGVFSNATSGTTTIAGNTMTAIANRAINFDDAVTAGERVNITGNDATSSRFTLVFDQAVTDATVQISGNTLASTVSNDAVIFDATITNSNVTIGGVAPADANDISGFQDGIDVAGIVGGTFAVTGNTRIVGNTGDGIEFEGTIDGAVVNVANNTAITGAVDGISFLNLISNGTAVTIAGNTVDGGEDGVHFDGAVSASTVTIGGGLPADANNIEGDGDGVDFSGTIGTGSNINIAGNQRIEGLGTFADEDGLGDGIAFRGAVSGATTNIMIGSNALIRGDDRGVNFASANTGGPATVTDANVTIASNTEIRGTNIDGILFNASLTNAAITIGGATAAEGNALIIGGDDGIDIENANGGTFTFANNTTITGSTFNGIEFEGAVNNGAVVAVRNNATVTGGQDGVAFLAAIQTNSRVNVDGNKNIVGARDGVVFSGQIGDTAAIVIDGNGSATQGGAPYDGTQPVDLDTFVATGAITGTSGSGVSFAAPITGSAAVTVSRNIVTASSDGVSFDSIGSTETTKIHNNILIANTDDAVAFSGDIAGSVEVFQNLMGNNGGDGVEVGPAAGIGTGNLSVQQNFLPGAGFTNGNGGFAFNMRGTGSADIDANWWGSIAPAGVASAVNGAPAPVLVLANGDDTNTPAAGAGATRLDPFAFQNDNIIDITPPPSSAFPPLAQFLVPFDFGPIRISNLQTPADVLWRPRHNSTPVFTNVFLQDFPLGACVLEGERQQPVCVDGVPNSAEVSAFFHAYVSSLPGFSAVN